MNAARTKRPPPPPPRKKMGRPLSDNPANKRVAIRATADQHARYMRAADAAGLTLTAWIEQLLDRASGAKS